MSDLQMNVISAILSHPIFLQRMLTLGISK
jgi:hypothetical protein